MPFSGFYVIYTYIQAHTHTHKIKNKLASKKDDKSGEQKESLVVTLLPSQQGVTKVRGEHGPTI